MENKFKVTIDDGFCAHEYVFQTDKENACISDIARAITYVIGGNVPESKLVREWNVGGEKLEF